MNFKIHLLKKEHWPSVSKIYLEGIKTGIATFETQIPSWETWDAKHISACRFVAIADNEIVGFAVLSKTSKRNVYSGVAEVSVYVSEAHKRQRIGAQLLSALITDSEAHGFWTLQASIFPQNKASIKLHEKCGFRTLGKREHIAQINGQWFDNILLEKRTKQNIIMKNILVLCTGNSCRSQMAHGYLNHFAKNLANVYSAGIETHGLNPGALGIMKEDGISIDHHTSNNVDEYAHVEFDYIVTVCDHANENCPFIPSKNALRLHHNFFDPSKVIGTDEEKHAAFLKARNEIKVYFENFVNQYLIN